MELLHIEGSPRGERSYSVRAGEALIESYLQHHSGAGFRTLNVFEHPLPAFDGTILDAKYAILHGLKHTPAQASAWHAVEAVIADFLEADAYLFTVPMWNFGLPYRLKHYLDVIIQPGYTFRYSAEKGYEGLVTGKPVAVVSARGGEYVAGTEAAAIDHEKPHIDLLLGFIGFAEIRSVVVEPTLALGPDEAHTRLQAAIVEAREVGRTLD
jgi:FMN-dependent NADH-azoreductase